MFICQSFSVKVLREQESDYLFCEFVGIVSSDHLQIVMFYNIHCLLWEMSLLLNQWQCSEYLGRMECKWISWGHLWRFQKERYLFFYIELHLLARQSEGNVKLVCIYGITFQKGVCGGRIDKKVKGESRTYYYKYFILSQHVYSTNAVIERLALLPA